jgi:hypothetical protein
MAVIIAFLLGIALMVVDELYQGLLVKTHPQYNGNKKLLIPFYSTIMYFKLKDEENESPVTENDKK